LSSVVVTHTRLRARKSACAPVALALTLAACGSTPVRVRIHPSELVADGNDLAELIIDGPSGVKPRITITNARLIDPAQIRASVMPGPITVRVEYPGTAPATAEAIARPANPDDYLHLDDDSDREAFRRWFTWLAEAQYFQDPSARPVEIGDCAALIRYAYREALHAHDSAWAQAARVPVVPPFASVAKYQYPFTPLGAALFRIPEGFAQFADAQTLRRYNTYFVSRAIARALPGDLLFFRQEDGTLPFHSMIFLGDSQVRRDGGPYLLYHTGPGGEIKRVSADELLHFPQPEWRPLIGNLNFLGVYRWNILR